jgi:hypothetical protein
VHAGDLDPSLKMPYDMRGELCAGVSVAIGREPREWARAMKCMLTNLKWLLAWAYRQER